METIFENREHGFEVKFAHDQEVTFRIRAHRNKLFAGWAAEQLADAAPPNYPEMLAGFAVGRTSDEIILHVLEDLRAYGIATAETKVRRAFELCAEAAGRDILHGDRTAASP